MMKQLEAIEMCFLRRMLRISWKTKPPMKKFYIKQMKFLGHVVGKEELDNMVLTGYVEGKRVQRSNTNRNHPLCIRERCMV